MAKERPFRMQEDVENKFWRFVDHKWKDSLNIAAADPIGTMQLSAVRMVKRLASKRAAEARPQS